MYTTSNIFQFCDYTFDDSIDRYVAFFKATSNNIKLFDVIYEHSFAL